jgi:hypothetical protein
LASPKWRSLLLLFFAQRRIVTTMWFAPMPGQGVITVYGFFTPPQDCD